MNVGHVHPDDPIKLLEHMAALRLVDPATALRAVGKSSEFHGGEMAGFAPTSNLHVPVDAEFLIDDDFDCRRLLFDGTLRVTDAACTIKFETIIGGTTGKLIVPASPHLRRFVVKPRGPRDRVGDPTDVSGGIILHSKSNLIAGEAKTRVAVPNTIGEGLLRFDEPVRNWKIGDRLLIPGVTWNSTDEVVRIVGIWEGGVLVTTEPIVHSHSLPVEYPAVGNLDCSVVIESQLLDSSQRGHVMVMHEHTGTMFSNVAFRNLGRTSVESTPTKIALDPDGAFLSGDANTIGRYPLHFHGRTGADRAIAPHSVSGCVIEGSPGHALVNHGSHVSAVGNVTYNAAGSHLFGENGIDIGDFTGNLCVFSPGRQSPVNRLDEFAKKNFGWEGTLVWLQGPGIDVVKNYMYRAKRALIEMDCEIIEPGLGQFSYPVSYIRPGPHRDMLEAKLYTGVFQVPARFVGNTGAGATFGMHFNRHLYDTKGFDTHIYPEPTDIYDTRMFNVDAGIAGTYVAHLDVIKSRFDGNLKLDLDPSKYSGMPSGKKVHDVTYIDCAFRRFQVAIVDRGWSDLVVDRCTFENNLIDISLFPRSSIKVPHTVTLARNQHLGRPDMAELYATKNPATVFGKPQDYWVQIGFTERTSLYEVEQFLVSPHTLDGRMLFYPHNAAAFVPFAGTGTEYDGKPNAQLMADHGVCVGGRYFVGDIDVDLMPGTNVPLWIEKAVDPPEPLTLEQRVERLEHTVFGY